MGLTASTESDLIFTIIGGSRNGNKIHVKSRKSILALGEKTESQANDPSLCAIYRGPAGTVIKNLNQELRVNGQTKTTHWLEQGDLIEFAQSVTLIVTDLGIIDQEDVQETSLTANYDQQHLSPQTLVAAADTNISSESSEGALALADPSQKNSDFDLSLRSDINDQESVAESKSPPESNLEPSSSTSGMIELSQFESLSKRVEDLADQLAHLVNLAKTGQFPTADGQPEVSSTPSPALNAVDALPSSEWIKSLAEQTKLPEDAISTSFSTDALESEKSSEASSETATLSESFDHFNPSFFARTEETPVSKAIDQSPFAVDASLQLTPPEMATSENSEERDQEPPMSQFEISAHSEDLSANSAPWSEQKPEEELDALLKRLFQNVTEETTYENPGSEPTDSPLNNSLEENQFRAIAEEHSPFPVENSSTDQANVSSWQQGQISNDRFDQEITEEDSELPSGKLEDESFATHSSNLSPDGDADSAFSPARFASWQQDQQQPQSSNLDSIESEKSAPPFSLAQQLLNEFRQGEKELSPDFSTEAAISSEAAISAETTQDSLQQPERTSNSAQESTEDYSAPNLSNSDAISDHQAPNSYSSPPEDMVVEKVVTEKVTTEEVDADNVEDYMNRLLARMNFKSSKPSASGASSTAPNPHPSNNTSEQDNEAPQPNLMQAEEYIPRRKAPKIESFATMRDIANSTARSAVAVSDFQRTKNRCLMQIIIATGALIMGLYYFLGMMKSIADASFWIGSICFAIAGALSLLAFNTLRKQKSAYQYIFQSARPSRLTDADGSEEEEN